MHVEQMLYNIKLEDKKILLYIFELKIFQNISRLIYLLKNR